MHSYLHSFLTSPDATFQHIAVWTIVQLLESGGESTPFSILANLTNFVLDPQLISNIRASTDLIPNIRTLATSRTTSVASSVGTPQSHHSQHSFQETETNDGQGEITMLSRRILDFVDLDIDGIVSTSVPGSQSGAHGTSIHSSRDDELRRSVRDALLSSSQQR